MLFSNWKIPTPVNQSLNTSHNVTSLIEIQRLVLPFWYRLTQVVLEKRPLNDVAIKKGKGSPYSITERRVPELMLVLGSQPADDVSHKPGCRQPLLSARPALAPATLKKAATNFAAW